MEDYLIGAFAMFVIGVIFILGFVAGQDGAARDCVNLGAFRHSPDIYECRKK